MSERLAASSVSWIDPSRAFHAEMRVAISDAFHEILVNQRVHEMADLLGDTFLFREHRLAPSAVLHGVSDWFCA